MKYLLASAVIILSFQSNAQSKQPVLVFSKLDTTKGVLFAGPLHFDYDALKIDSMFIYKPSCRCPVHRIHWKYVINGKDVKPEDAGTFIEGVSTKD